MLASFLSRVFLFPIPCWLHFYAGSFSYISRAVLQKWLPIFFLLKKNTNTVTKDRQLFIWQVSLTHPMLASFYVGSFSHKSHAGFFMWASYTSGAGFFLWKFFSYMSHADLFLLGIYLTHPVLAA